MKILFLCGSLDSQESCSMTLAETGLDGIAKLAEPGKIRETIVGYGAEVTVVDNLFGFMGEIKESAEFTWLFFRVRDRMTPLSWRRGAIQEILQCAELGIQLAHVDEEIAEVLSGLCGESVLHLPDVYGTKGLPKMSPLGRDDSLRVGCFKGRENSLAQGFAALELHRRTQCPVVMHYQSPNAYVSDNLKALSSGDFQVVLHNEMPRPERRKLISALDVGLQVSHHPERLIVSDYIDMGIPVVTGTSEEWISPWTADHESPSDMCDKMVAAMKSGKLGTALNKFLLKRGVKRSRSVWKKFSDQVLV